MNIEEQDLILQIINQKEIIKSFLLTDAKNREEFKTNLSRIISNKDINLEKIIDELIDLYNSLLKIARFKNTRAQSLEDFDRIMDNITEFINSGGRYNKDFLNMIIIGLKEQYNEISKLLSVKNNKIVIDLFRKNYLNDFDEFDGSKEEKIRKLKEISKDISEEIIKDENEVFEILKNFFKHQTQFYNLTNLKIFSILLNSRMIDETIYDRIDKYEKLKKLSFEEMEFEDLKTNKDFIKIVEEVKKELLEEKIEIDKDIIYDEDIYEFFGGGNTNKKLIKEIQSFLKKYKNRNNDKLIKVLKQLKKISQ